MRGANAVTHPDDLGPGLVFRLKTLNTNSVARAKTPEDVLPICLAHNLRQLNGDHRHRRPINSARTPSNSILVGPADPEVAAELAANILAELGLTLPARVDAVAGFEGVIQPPDGFDTTEFWGEALAWVRGRYQHVISFVVHHDQKRPHAHVLVLPVLDGELAGSTLQTGEHGFPRQRQSFLAHMRAKLGLRPDRKTKTKTLTDIALSTGKGAKTRAAEARRDAQLQRATGAEWVAADVGMKVDGHECRAEQTATFMPTTFRIAQVSPHAHRLEKLHFMMAAARPPMRPCPPPPKSPLEPAGNHRQPAPLGTLLGAGPCDQTSDAMARRDERQPGANSTLADVFDSRDATGQAAAPQVPAQARQMPAGLAPAQAAPPMPSPTHQEAVTGAPCVVVEHLQAPAATTGLEGAPQTIHGRVSVSDSVGASGRPGDDADTGGFSRERDSVHQAGAWDEETGEFIRPPPDRGTPGRLAAERHVRQLLSQRSIRP